MKRRDFVRKLGAGTLLGGALSACGEQPQQKMSDDKQDNRTWQWSMVTAWPKNFPVIGTGVEHLANLIRAMSGGRLQIKVYGSGELVPAFECFDAVSQGAVQMGHGASYYWKGKNPAFQFFSSIPFGMNMTQMNAWLYEGGGLELWEEIYSPFGVLPIPSGSTGIQMGGWFNREINSIEDLKGLKMRIPGLGGEVLGRAGVSTVTLPGSELLTSLQTGVIDALEWINPYGDLVFGLHKVAKYYYYPGWQEPTVNLECIINQQAWDELPPDLQHIVRAASKVVHHKINEEYTAFNGQALDDLVNKHNVQMRQFPESVLDELKSLSAQVMRELGESDEMTMKVYNSYMQFKKNAQTWHNISEKLYYQVMGQ